MGWVSVGHFSKGGAAAGVAGVLVPAEVVVRVSVRLRTGLLDMGIGSWDTKYGKLGGEHQF